MSEREPKMRRGPDGDLYPVPLEHDCEDGWRGEDLEGRPIPCPQCRAHLHRQRGQAAQIAGLSGWTTTKDPHQHRSGGDR